MPSKLLAAPPGPPPFVVGAIAAVWLGPAYYTKLAGPRPVPLFPRAPELANSTTLSTSLWVAATPRLVTRGWFAVRLLSPRKEDLGAIGFKVISRSCSVRYGAAERELLLLLPWVIFASVCVLSFTLLSGWHFSFFDSFLWGLLLFFPECFQKPVNL